MNEEQREEGVAMVEVETEVTRTVEVGGGDADRHGTTPAGGAGEEMAKVRELVLRAHPDVVPELVRGNSVDELLASIESARSAYQQVADRVQGGQSQNAGRGEAMPTSTVPVAGAEATSSATAVPPRVPAGGAVNAVNLDDIPPAEKIARALAARQK